MKVSREKKLPDDQSKAMVQSLQQFASDGLDEAKDFLAVLLEAKAYTAIKILPPPVVPVDRLHVASVTEMLLQISK